MSNPTKKEQATGCETPSSSNGFVKSSAYAPVSLNLTGMYLIKEHMNAHYKRIYNVKAAVDTRAPLSMQNRIKSASRVNSRCSSRHSIDNKIDNKIDKYIDTPSTNSPARHYDNPRDYKSIIHDRKSQRAERLREYINESFGPSTSKYKDEPVQKRTNHDKSRVVPALRIQRDLDHARWLKDQARKKRAEQKLNELEHSFELNESDEELENYLNSPIVSPKSREVAPIARFSRPKSPKRYSIRSLVKEQLEAQEEELKYLEFITHVTNDILLRGVYTDRALKQVFQYHMNRRNDLSFNKMKNLLGKLQDDLGIPRFEKQFTSTFQSNSNEENYLKHKNEWEKSKKATIVRFSPELRTKWTNSTESESKENIKNSNESVNDNIEDEESFENDLEIEENDISNESASINDDKNDDSSLNYSNEDFDSSQSEN